MFVSKLFSGIGIVCILLAGILLWQRNNPGRVRFLSAPVQKINNQQVKKNLPVRLIIKSANIDLQIYPAKIIGQNWETTSLGVSWLDISPLPGDTGNSIIYGHNWNNLLGNLINSKPGNQIEVTYTDGSSRFFTIDKTAVVSPKNVSVLSQTNERMLTIYTCVGFFDEKRFVVAGILNKNSAEM